MKIICTTVFLLTIFLAEAQNISVMDFVKVKDGRHAETIYYYENNWKLYRDSALQRGFITSYRMSKVIPDSASMYDLVLITEYADSSMWRKSEENFQPILKAIRPNGPIRLNQFKSDEFRKIVSSIVIQTVLTNATNNNWSLDNLKGR